MFFARFETTLRRLNLLETSLRRLPDVSLDPVVGSNVGGGVTTLDFILKVALNKPPKAEPIHPLT